MQEIGNCPCILSLRCMKVAKNVLKACYEGGSRVFEFTNRGDFAHEVFAELNHFALNEFQE